MIEIGKKKQGLRNNPSSGMKGPLPKSFSNDNKGLGKK